MPTPSSAPAPSASAEPSTGSLHGHPDEFARARPKNDNPSVVRVSEILVAYRGAEGAPSKVTRSKAEAEKLAEYVALQVRVGVGFEELLKKYSDDPTAAKTQGDLGKLTRAQLGKPVPDAAFILFPQETSEPVETPTGFHILKRTE